MTYCMTWLAKLACSALLELLLDAPCSQVLDLLAMLIGQAIIVSLVESYGGMENVAAYSIAAYSIAA